MKTCVNLAIVACLLILLRLGVGNIEARTYLPTMQREFLQQRSPIVVDLGSLTAAAWCRSMNAAEEFSWKVRRSPSTRGGRGMTLTYNEKLHLWMFLGPWTWPLYAVIVRGLCRAIKRNKEEVSE